jgi:hypothetical protein
MPTLYVAVSKELGKWGSDVGISKNLYKLGVAADDAQAAVERLNEEGHAGQRDWKLLKQQPVEELTEAEAIARLARKEKMVDPAYYPRLRGAVGIFRIKPDNVENHLMVAQALAGEAPKLLKLKPVDIAGYLMENAAG